MAKQISTKDAGRKGGKKTLKVYGKAHFSKIGKKRWDNTPIPR